MNGENRERETVENEKKTLIRCFIDTIRIQTQLCKNLSQFNGLTQCFLHVCQDVRIRIVPIKHHLGKTQI
jgi:hypothetical protein